MGDNNFRDNVGKLRPSRQVTFVCEMVLQGFEVVEGSNNYPAYGSYQLGTADGRSVHFTGWCESGAGSLPKNRPYTVAFEYNTRFDNPKPRVIGISINGKFDGIETDVNNINLD